MSEAERHSRRSRQPDCDRQDLVQDVILRVLKRLRNSRVTGSVSALVRRTMAGLIVDRRRRSRALADASEVAEAEPSATPSPLEWAQTSEGCAAVRMAIADLPKLQREVVQLRYYEGLRFREIAARQEVPLNTVLGRMHLATLRLRQSLENHND